MAYTPIQMGGDKHVNGFLINFEQLMKNDGVMLSFRTNGQIWSDSGYVENCSDV